MGGRVTASAPPDRMIPPAVDSPYTTLGNRTSSTDEDVKKALKKRAVLFHPDKHPEATEPEDVEYYVNKSRKK